MAADDALGVTDDTRGLSDDAGVWCRRWWLLMML